jgi:endonuclease/exonuclease/phosphatase family metal-dependent hydrolase
VLQAEDQKRPYANAVLFRRSRFEVVSTESRSRAQIVVLLERAQHAGALEAGESTGGGEQQLTARASGGVNLLYLANVHLQKGSQAQITRLLQLRSLFKHLATHREAQGRAHSTGGKRGGRAARNGAAKTSDSKGKARLLTESSVICGDFNSGRHSEVYELMREGGLRKFPSTQRRPDGTLGGGAKAYRTGFLPLKDAYVARPPAWGPFTYSHCSGALLDYMWVSIDLEVLETLPRSRSREDLSRGLKDAPLRAVGEDGSVRPAIAAHEPRRLLPSRDGRYVSDHLPSGVVLAPRMSLVGP